MAREKTTNHVEPSDADVRALLVQAMADVGADPAIVYAFQRTGVYLCEENERTLPTEKLQAFDAAVEEYEQHTRQPN
jgi:transcriptional/translational regulatory protein YebC/TACO1